MLSRLNEDIAAADSKLATDRARLAQVLAVMQRLRAGYSTVLMSDSDRARKVMRASLQAGGAMTTLYLRTTELRSQLNQMVNLQSEAGRKRAEAASGEHALADTRDELDRLIVEKRTQGAALAVKAQRGPRSTAEPDRAEPISVLVEPVRRAGEEIGRLPHSQE